MHLAALRALPRPAGGENCSRGALASLPPLEGGGRRTKVRREGVNSLVI